MLLMPPVSRPLAAAVLAVAGLFSAPVWAVDEIQVYNGEINKVGELSLEKHFNYAINGLKKPDFDGGLVPHHALNGTPELAYGVTNWYEVGLYLPYAVDHDGNFYSNGFKIRHLFAVPDANKREFFYGVNFEFSYTTPKFSETRFATEIRPIIGFRKGDYELIINPIVDIGFGSKGEVEFFPALRFAKKLGEDLAIGAEYYSGYGPFGRFLPLAEQQHNIFGVIDFKLGRFDINAGLGYGMTQGSDRLLAKLIVGTNLN
jgi:hypothetical protein